MALVSVVFNWPCTRTDKSVFTCCNIEPVFLQSLNDPDVNFLWRWKILFYVNHPTLAPSRGLRNLWTVPNPSLILHTHKGNNNLGFSYLFIVKCSYWATVKDTMNERVWELVIISEHILSCSALILHLTAYGNKVLLSRDFCCSYIYRRLINQLVPIQAANREKLLAYLLTFITSSND